MGERSRDGGGALSLLFVLVGAAGFAGGLTALYIGMRDLMYDGGSCASGGPYAIQNECTNDQITLLMGGIFVMLIFGGVLMGASSRYGGSSFLGTGLLMWAALFGALGFNFISLGFNPPENMSGAGGWIASGVVFWLMALGGLIPGLAELKSFVARGDEPEPTMFDAPLVRAKVPVAPMPGFPGGFPGASTPGDQVTPPQREGERGEVAPAAGTEFVDPVTGERHGGVAGGVSGAGAAPGGSASDYEPPRQSHVPKRIVIPPPGGTPPGDDGDA
ncbi:MAG: hypothetical protein HZB14_10375 [Actinobacteria bacterium]|nr:hypothetical protein [Actinomycetota bacterium]